MDSMDVRECSLKFFLFWETNSFIFLQSEGIDAEADREVDKVITEITSGVLSGAGSAPVRAPPAAAKAQAEAAPAVAEEEGPSADDLLRRLQAL